MPATNRQVFSFFLGWSARRWCICWPQIARQATLHKGTVNGEKLRKSIVKYNAFCLQAFTERLTTTVYRLVARNAYSQWMNVRVVRQSAYETGTTSELMQWGWSLDHARWTLESHTAWISSLLLYWTATIYNLIKSRAYVHSAHKCFFRDHRSWLTESKVKWRDPNEPRLPDNITAATAAAVAAAAASH